MGLFFDDVTLETMKNGVKYRIWKRSDVSDKYTNGAVSLQISAIEYFCRKDVAEITERTICKSFEEHNGIFCVLIIAPTEERITYGCIPYRADGGGYTTGICFSREKPSLLSREAETYGTFSDTYKGGPEHPLL
jgi:hypothetical protein